MSWMSGDVLPVLCPQIENLAEFLRRFMRILSSPIQISDVIELCNPTCNTEAVFVGNLTQYRLY